MRKVLGLGLLAMLACAAAVPAVRPVTALALEGPTWLAGDTVRFVARFQAPAGAVLDSVTIAWNVGSAPNRFRSWRPPIPATMQDTVRIEAGPVSGGATIGGAVVVRTWRGDMPSAGVIRTFAVDRPDLGPPPDVTGFAWLDSARVIP